MVMVTVMAPTAPTDTIWTDRRLKVSFPPQAGRAATGLPPGARVDG